MSIKELTKSGGFVLAMLALVVVLLPFAAEQIGDATGLFKLHPTKWAKGLFASKTAKDDSKKGLENIDWDQKRKDIEAFSEWTKDLATAKINIVRPEVFQIVKNCDKDTVTDKDKKCAWKLLSLSGEVNVSAAQVRDKLKLFCEPKDKVSGRIASVESYSEGNGRGFLVTVDGLGGEGRIGLAYGDMVPVYYNVKLRRLWLVPVASCRSAMKGRYDSAVFFPGMEKGLPEGAVISPGDDKCGYRILSVSDHCVWFESFYGDNPPEDVLPHSIWPDFSRVDTMAPTPPPGRLIFGKSRCFWPGEAIKLPNSGSYLLVDGFLAGRAAVFRLLDRGMRPSSDLMCVIVREK